MNKILVTTDFSANSKGGIRFALQLAKQTKCKLVFFNTQDLPKPTRWSEEKYNAYATVELKKTHARLMQFVNGVSLQTGLKAKEAQFVVMEGNEVSRSVIDYAKQIKANYICMSTRGAGVLKKLVGTHASFLLTTSPVPVMVVPKNYRISPIGHILYSSDMDNLSRELKKVISFAKPLKAKVSVYHYDFLLPLKETQMKLEKKAAKYKFSTVKFHFDKLHIEDSLASHLQKDIRKTKPSLVALFTNQNRGWFDKLFLPSKSAAISFDTKTPLLVYKKSEN
jgi:nucleotide-binding universal stress UspA family protein